MPYAERDFATAGDDIIATSKIKKLVHLSQQTYLPNTRLVPDPNDKGYGLIEAEDSRDIYFPHQVVEGRRRFDDLRRGQEVEYTLETAPYLRANLVRFPRVIGSDDFARAVAAVDRIGDQLGMLRRPPIGAMIETPAALYALDEIIELADFVAIGTNDLTPYMLAADRDLAEGSDDCTAMPPAVLRAIRQVVEAAEARQCPVCVCGEEAGDPDFACLLVGLGIHELSLNPRRSAAVRKAIRGINSQRAKHIADRALRCRTPGDTRQLLSQLHSSEAIRAPCKWARTAND